MSKESVRVWNRACEVPDGEHAGERARGDRQLAAMVQAHSLVMNGGVAHAFEALSSDERRRAADAFRYYGLHPLGELFECDVELPEDDDDAADELEEELNEAYWSVAPDDDAVMLAFERHFAAHREEYEPGDTT